MLTISQILRLREMRPSHHAKLDLLKALPLQARPLLEPLLGVGEPLALLEQEPERDAMRPAGLAVELEHRDHERLVMDLGLLGRYPLRHDRRVVVDADDGVVARQFPEELVVADLVDADLAGLFLAGDLGLLDQVLDEVDHVSALGDENVVLVL